MSDIDPSALLEISPDYVSIEPCRRNSPEAIVIKAVGCFLLGGAEDIEEIDTPIPGIPAPELTENDTFEISYSRYATEHYLIGPDRTVIFDQFHSREDEFGYLYIQADQGYISMQIEEEGLALVQYIFCTGNLENGDPFGCKVFCGWEISDDTLVEDPTHLRRLGTFLDKVSRIILHTELAEVADLPEIEMYDSPLEGA